MSTYPSLDEYNADIMAARAAYAADMAVESGMCAVCKVRRIDAPRRKCWSCRHDGRIEVGR